MRLVVLLTMVLLCCAGAETRAAAPEQRAVWANYRALRILLARRPTRAYFGPAGTRGPM